MKAFLEAYNLFTEGEINQVISLGEVKKIKKGDYFIQEGDICKKVAFINSGIFRSFYYSSEDDEATYCINFPRRFLTAYSSFITQEKSKENIQALTDGELFYLNKDLLDEVQLSNPKWMLFAKQIAEEQYLELEKRIFQLQHEKAEKRYDQLITEHPEYIQHIPLQHLASYLGISQRHLSRIRKQITFSN